MTDHDRTLYGVPLEDAVRVREMLNAANAPEWRAGSSEPWIVRLLASLITACGARTAIEIGCFDGYASVHIVEALSRQPWPTRFIGCEIDVARAERTAVALGVYSPRVDISIVQDDSHTWIPTLPNESIDFAWVDGNHELEHVEHELELLIPKMSRGGIICGHDVSGVCGLWRAFKKYGGYSLDIARLGPAGGIGIIQRPTDAQILEGWFE